MKHFYSEKQVSKHSFFFRGAFKYLPMLALCSSLSAVSHADDHRAALPLSINNALALSLKFHPIISSKKLEYQAALAELSAARWSAFPDTSFSFRGFQKDDNEQSRDQEILSVSQPIWTGGKISGGINLAKAQRDAAQLAIVLAEQTLLEETARSFVELHRANIKVEISASNVAEHERLFEIINRRVKASTSPEVDLRLAKARLAYSQSQYLQNNNAREVSRAKLEQRIGQPVFEIIPPQREHIGNMSLDEVEKSVIAFSPALRKKRAEIVGLEASEKVSKSALFPQISLGYERRYGELLANQEPEQVFLGVDFQPGAGLSARSSIIVSRARKAALRDGLAALERDIRQEVQITWRELKAAEMQLTPTKVLAETTADVVASFLRQYTVGRKSWLDVLNAQRELVQARQALADHTAKLTMASFKMQILTGALNGKHIGEPK